MPKPASTEYPTSVGTSGEEDCCSMAMASDVETEDENASESAGVEEFVHRSPAYCAELVDSHDAKTIASV
jgi:hypothetical protein